MTVQYNGGGNYTIYIGHRELILHQSEIEEIQSYDFINADYVIYTHEELRDKIEDLEWQITNLQEELDDR